MAMSKVNDIKIKKQKRLVFLMSILMELIRSGRLLSKKLQTADLILYLRQWEPQMRWLPAWMQCGRAAGSS